MSMTDGSGHAVDELNLDGLSVSTTRVLVPGVSMTGATLEIWGASPFNVTTRPWNATAADIDSAVKFAIPGFDPSVSRQRCDI